MSGVLVDTSVLIRAYLSDPQDPGTGKAKDAVEDLARRGIGFVSAQALDEFAAVLLARSVPAVEPARLGDVIAGLGDVFGILRPGARTLQGALSGMAKHGLRFWDSKIWALAWENGIDEVWTADPPPRPELGGVRYRNPLA